MTKQTDWSRFVVRINIRTSRSRLYEAWASSAGMEAWFLRSCEYTDAGGRLLDPDKFAVRGTSYKFLWHGYTDDTFEFGEVLDANGRDYFRFRFGKAGTCTVRILLAGDELIVELEQEEIPLDEASRMMYHVGCKAGWTFYLTNLKSLMEGGIDLRNTDINLQDMLNA